MGAPAMATIWLIRTLHETPLPSAKAPWRNIDGSQPGESLSTSDLRRIGGWRPGAARPAICGGRWPVVDSRTFRHVWRPFLKRFPHLWKKLWKFAGFEQAKPVGLLVSKGSRPASCSK
jgi:hypothetical protein